MQQEQNYTIMSFIYYFTLKFKWINKVLRITATAIYYFETKIFGTFSYSKHSRDFVTGKCITECFLTQQLTRRWKFSNKSSAHYYVTPCSSYWKCLAKLQLFFMLKLFDFSWIYYAECLKFVLLCYVIWKTHCEINKHTNLI